jgi:hypothetical protein
MALEEVRDITRDLEVGEKGDLFLPAPVFWPLNELGTLFQINDTTYQVVAMRHWVGYASRNSIQGCSGMGDKVWLNLDEDSLEDWLPHEEG